MQQYADIYLLLNYSTYFGRPSRPSSGIYKTLVAASGTDHAIWGVSFFKRDHVVTLHNPSLPGPGVDSACNRSEYQEYFLGVKAAGA